MTAPEPREDVAEVLAAITDPIHAGGCYYRHQQGEVDECNSCTAHRIETRVAEALAPLIAERVRAASEQAWDEGFATGTESAYRGDDPTDHVNPYRADRRAER